VKRQQIENLSSSWDALLAIHDYRWSTSGLAMISELTETAFLRM
jgi:hypothetical protein